MTEPIVVARRFRGPSTSGNGGYSAGLLAGLAAPPVEVTLRRPPPLDRELRVVRDGNRVSALDGDAVVAEAVTVDPVDLAPPLTVGYDEAERAAAAYRGLDSHIFPECFTCGPARGNGDGLRLFTGPVAPGVVAATWTPDESVADEHGVVWPAVVWAALDCPGAWAGEIGEARPAVLGRLAADERRPVRAGEHLVVVGWAIEDQPRKFLAGSALQTPDGEVIAVGRATWVRVPLDWSPEQVAQS